jgi:hypothetical protein
VFFLDLAASKGLFSNKLYILRGQSREVNGLETVLYQEELKGIERRADIILSFRGQNWNFLIDISATCFSISVI